MLHLRSQRAGGPALTPMAGVAAVSGLLLVTPLVAWSYQLGSFQVWLMAVSLPAAAGLALLARSRLPGLRVIVVAGCIGGLVGTLGYDLFRLPFVAAGWRLLAPIDSYGVLALGADTSSPLSGFVGWAYHFANGIGFGVAYAAVAAGRRWWWAVVWGLVLETATVVTPFATTYQIAGQWDLIAVAYAAHVAYGVPLGMIVERAESFVAGLGEMTRAPLRWTVGPLLVALVLWHRPFALGDNRPATMVTGGRFAPQWVRVPVGGCAAVANHDPERYHLAGPVATGLAPGEVTTVCFPEAGVHRVRVSTAAYSGGWVIVDPAMKGGADDRR